MVEFGLKLADNKVEEWAAAYIDYEGLKKLIAAAQRAEKARNDLEARNASLAADIKASYYQTQAEEARLVGFDSDLSLEGADEASETVSLLSFPPEGNGGASNHYGGMGMGTGLSSFSNHGSLSLNGSSNHLPVNNASSSHLNGMGMKRTSSETSLTSLSVIDNVTKTFTGYFQRSSYKHKMIKAIRAEDEAIQAFHKRIHEEIEKVNELYDRVIAEMKDRLDYLVEIVSSSEDFNTVKSFNKKNNLLESVRLHMTSIVNKKLIDISNEMEGLDDTDGYDDMEDLTHSQREQAKSLADKVIRESDSIQREMTDLHRRSKLLSNFANMNSTGFIKIIKKFDKSFPPKKGMFKAILSKGNVCRDGKDVEQLSARMERLFAKWFCDGNITEARSVMLPKKGDGLDMDWSQLRLGYRLGMCSVLALWVAWDCVWGLVEDGHSTIGGRTAFPVFRASGGLVLVHWFWGISVYVWNRFRINYIYLFDFDPRIVQTPIMIFEDATDETLLFLLLMLLYYKAGAHDIPDIIPPGCYPIILVLFGLKRLIFPLKTRIPMWVAIFKVVTAPLTKPTFFHTYCADVFTSMVKVFQDLLWTLCFFISGDFLITERDNYSGIEPKNWHNTFWYKNILIPLICLAPLWIRFNQCLRRYMDTGKRNPNLLNAGKYALSQTVTLFGAFHPLYLMYVEREADITHDDTLVEMVDAGRSPFDSFWMGIFVSSSLYSYFWDVYMDWGLGRVKQGFLGTRLMFPKKHFYYVVIVLDLFLRFMWVTTLIPPQSGAKFEIPQYLNMATMSLELFRRTIWGFFRLEHEHRHNSQGFRRVDFVPLHFSTESKTRDKVEHAGWNVLGEVVFVTLVVVTISAGSVIAAQKATNEMALRHVDSRDL